MARFILDYDTSLNQSTIEIITYSCTASMISPYETSAQYCLIDVIAFLDDEKMHNSEVSTDGITYNDSDIQEDYEYLQELQKENVDYIEICF
jgi:hypothetical protein